MSLTVHPNARWRRTWSVQWYNHDRTRWITWEHVATLREALQCMVDTQLANDPVRLLYRGEVVWSSDFTSER